MIEQPIASPLSQRLSKNNSSIITIEQYKLLILNNLNYVLNTRSSDMEKIVNQRNLATSILNYGVKFSKIFATNNSFNIEKLCHHLQTVINQYEPRLTNISVFPQESDEQLLTLNIIIQAEMLLPNNHQAVFFNSTYNPINNHFNLEAA